MSSVTAEARSVPARTPPVFALLLRLLTANWTWGRLTLTLPNGEVHQLEGQTPGPNAVMNIVDYRFARRVLASGDIGYAEGYIAGEWDSPHLAVLLDTTIKKWVLLPRVLGNQ